jgi:hypothetical protein
MNSECLKVILYYMVRSVTKLCNTINLIHIKLENEYILSTLSLFSVRIMFYTVFTKISIIFSCGIHFRHMPTQIVLKNTCIGMCSPKFKIGLGDSHKKMLSILVSSRVHSSYMLFSLWIVAFLFYFLLVHNILDKV